MNLLKEINDFAGSQVQDRKIEYKGKTKTFYFRELDAGEAEDLFSIFTGLDDRQRAKASKGFRNKVLAKILCDEDGAPNLSVEDAAGIRNQLAVKLMDAALEVNGLDTKKDEKAGGDEGKE
jgi:hypothetical protein